MLWGIRRDCTLNHHVSKHTPVLNLGKNTAFYQIKGTRYMQKDKKDVIET